MALTKAHNRMVEGSVFNVLDFGAVGDGVTDDTAALQAALDAVFDNDGGTIRIPAGDYLITADLVPQISTVPLNRSFRILGDGMETTNIIGAGVGLKIYGDTPPARNNAFTSVLLESFSMVGSGLTGIGIDVYSMQRCMISGVSCRGYNYGVQIRSSWNNSINNRCQFEENNVGIKIPVAGSGSTLNEGFNANDISGISCRSNIKAGISIGFCNAITIRDVLLESNPVGIYILQAAQWVTLDTLYYEVGSIILTRTSRAGALTAYLIYTGSDEDFTVGDTFYPINNLVVNNAMEYFGEGKIWLDNVNNFYNPNGAVTTSTLYNVTGNVKFIRGHGLEADNRFSTLLQDNATASTANGVFKSYPYNFINNGNFALPNLPVFRNTTGTATAVRDTQAVDGVNSSVMAVTLPTGEATNTFFFTVNLGNEFGVNGAQLSASIRCKASTTDVASVKLELRNSAGSILSSFPAVKTTGVDDWFALNFTADPTEFGGTPSVLLRVEVTRTSAAADDTFYIDEIILTPREAAGLTVASPQDYDCGLTGSVTPTTSSGSWFFADVDPVVGSGSFGAFRVIATPRYDGTQTAAEVQIEYLGGANDGTFRVWCSRTGVTIDYRIMLVSHHAP